MQELENSDNESANNESEDESSGSEDDFEGYLDESIDQTADESSDEEQNEEEQSNEEDMEGVIPLIPSYTPEPGVSVTISGSRPLDIFRFVNRDMLQHIVEQTNLNAEQYMSSHTLAPGSRIRQWLKQHHTLSELQRFIALILVMGLVRYPKVESHWSTSWPYATEAFSSVTG